MKNSHIMILFITLMAISSNVTAKQLYIAPHGADNISRAQNSESSPWQTLGRAVWGSTDPLHPNTGEAAQPGDEVIVKTGVYTTTHTSGERYIPTYNPVNTGTSNNSRITFRTASGEHVVLQGFSGHNNGGPLIGSYDRSYITWDGFIINEPVIGTSSDTGPVVVWDSDNITLQNLTIIGKTADWNDNHNGIRIEDSRDSLITNNHIYGIRNSGMNANGAAIMVYTSSNITFEYNDISDSGAGIFLKGANTGPFIVRYNDIYNIDGGAVIIGGVGTSQVQNGARIYRNILRDSAEGVTLVGYDSHSPANIYIVNNTIDNCSNGGIFLKPSTDGYLNIVSQNNIITNSSLAIQAEDISSLSQITFSHNLYSGNSGHARLQYNNYSLSLWSSSLNKDTVGSMTSDPQYINPTSNDFRLSASSPAIDAGVDILNLGSAGESASIDMGAYISGAELNNLGRQGSVPLPSAPAIIAP